MLGKSFSSCWEQGYCLWGTWACCGGFSCCRAWAPGYAGFSRLATWALGQTLVVVAHRLSCSAACGIFPGLGSDLCLLNWHVDSLPLSHQESPVINFLLCNLPMQSPHTPQCNPFYIQTFNDLSKTQNLEKFVSRWTLCWVLAEERLKPWDSHCWSPSDLKFQIWLPHSEPSMSFHVPEIWTHVVFVKEYFPPILPASKFYSFFKTQPRTLFRTSLTRRLQVITVLSFLALFSVLTQSEQSGCHQAWQ